MRHAYLIQIHTNFALLNRLLEFLDGEENDFYILIDKKVKQTSESLITYKTLHSKVYEVPRIAISWAGYSSIMAEMELLKYAQRHGAYDYFHYMQGADFPIKSRKDIQAFFENHAGQEFIFFNPDIYKEGKYKLNYHHFFVNNRFYRKNKPLHYLSHGIAMVEKKLGLTRYKGRRFYSGSALWVISDAFCKYLLENEAMMKKMARFTIAADEALFQTIIMESPFRDKIFRFEEEGGNLYYIDWKRREGNSPYTFAEKDFDIIKDLPEYYLYARKFHERKSKTLIEKIMACFGSDL